jgi:hypothetical protein
MKVKEDAVGGACRTHGQIRNSYKILVIKLEGTLNTSTTYLMMADTPKHVVLMICF